MFVASPETREGETLKAILDRLKTVRVAAPRTVHNLAMFPLLDSRNVEPGYLTLDQALDHDTVTIDEVSESGSVPELTLINRGELPVLLVDGEELVGAKQNRILNLTILVEALTTTVIPVSCVEAGRWSRRSASFASAARTQYAAGRAMKIEQVSRSLKERGDRRSDQSEVWADISAKSARLAASSDTGAMSAMYEQRAGRIDEYVEAMAPTDSQAGAAFAIEGRLIGLDLFDAGDTLRRLFPKLVRIFALDAIDRPERLDQVEAQAAEVEAFLEQVGAASAESFSALGIGEDIRFDADALAGAALVANGRVVHLSAFCR